jgi:hypothetical protein
LLAVFLFAIGTNACGDSDNDARDEAATVNETVGTTGDGANLQQPEAPADDGQRNREDLPSTASPLAVAGLLGLLSLGGAVVVRMLGRL